MDPHDPELNVQPIIDWLMDGAKPAKDPKDGLRLVCERMLACGLRLQRVAVFVRPLHPNVAARAFYWREGIAAILSLATQSAGGFTDAEVIAQ